MSRPFTWDLNDECKLIGLWCDKRNLSSAEIAKHFEGRYSSASIRMKARELNLPRRKGGYSHVARRCAVAKEPTVASIRPISLAPLPARRSP
jgi:hypothetical protein